MANRGGRCGPNSNRLEIVSGFGIGMRHAATDIDLFAFALSFVGQFDRFGCITNTTDGNFLADLIEEHLIILS